MTMDHFPGNPLGRVSNPYFGLFGFFTAALGFVFLSGLIAGTVYERHRVVYGTRSMLRRIGRRIRDLYVTQMIIFLILAALLMLHLSGDWRWHLELVSNHPWKGLAFGSFLLYEPSYFGILPMYCFFLLLTPAVLWLFRKGNARYVIVASAVLWMVSGLLIGIPGNPYGADFGAFNPLSYQFLFIVGLAFGTRELSIERISSVRRRWLIGSCLVVAAGCFLLRQQYAFDGPFNGVLNRFGDWFSAVELGPLRLVSFAAFGVALSWICRKIEWRAVDSSAFRWLAFVGRHSLPVFAWSILMTYAAIALFPPDPDAALRIIGVVLGVSSLTIPAYLHAVVRQRRMPLPARPITAALEVESARRAA